MEERSSTIETRSSTMEERLATLELRSATMEERSTTIETRLATVEERSTTIETRFATMETRFATMETPSATQRPPVEAKNRPGTPHVWGCWIDSKSRETERLEEKIVRGPPTFVPPGSIVETGNDEPGTGDSPSPRGLVCPTLAGSSIATSFTTTRFTMPTKNTAAQSTTTASPSPAPAPAATGAPVITSTSPHKVPAEVAFQTLVAGIPLVFPGQTSFQLPSGTYSLDELLAPLQKRIAAAEATKTALAQWHDAVQAERGVAADANARRKEVKQLAAARYGAQSTKLSVLGFTPAKPRKVPASTKANAAAQSKATRAAKKAALEAAAAAPEPKAAPAAGPAPAATAAKS
jgi:hypothetical protein